MGTWEHRAILEGNEEPPWETLYHHGGSLCHLWVIIFPSHSFLFVARSIEVLFLKGTGSDLLYQLLASYPHLYKRQHHGQIMRKSIQRMKIYYSRKINRKLSCEQKSTGMKKVLHPLFYWGFLVETFIVKFEFKELNNKLTNLHCN